MAILTFKNMILLSNLKVNAILLAWLSMASDPILIEFILGYLLAYYRDIIFMAIKKVHKCFFYLLVFLSAPLVFWEVKTLSFIEDLHLGVMFLPAISFFLYAIKTYDFEKEIIPKFLLFTSRISYSIYLLHMAVIFIVIDVYRFFYGEEVFNSFSDRFNLIFISLVSTWSASYFFYIFIEEKLSKVLRKFISIKDRK